MSKPQTFEVMECPEHGFSDVSTEQTSGVHLACGAVAVLSRISDMWFYNHGDMWRPGVMNNQRP